jgi:predicted NBD/HSP70 family sugar kinase
MKKLTNTMDIRVSNAISILQMLRHHPSKTKSKLALDTGLSFSSSSNIASILVDKGLLKIDENSLSTGGRKAACLSFNGDFAYAVVLDLHDNRTGYLGLVNMSNEIVKIVSFDIKSSDTLDDIQIKISKANDELMKGVTIPIIGVCCAIAAVFLANSNIVLSCSNPVFEGVNIVSIVRDLFNHEFVVIENDANLAILAHSFDEESASKISIFLTQGVGMGIMINNQLYTGKDGIAGELGHMKVRGESRTCKCGHQGCLRLFIPLESIAYDLGEIKYLEEGLSNMEYASQLAKRYIEGESAVIERVDLAKQKLGETLAQLLDIFNPNEFIICGNMSQLFKIIEPGVKEICRDYSKLAKTFDAKITFDTTVPNKIMLIGGSERLFNQWLFDGFERYISD